MAYNTFNSNYASNSGVNSNYNYHSPYTKVPRQWLIFAQYLGTFFSVLGLIIYLYYMKSIYHSLPNGDLTNKSVVALILAVIVYYVWRSIYMAFVIVRWAKRSTDEELCANRYIISALSLGVGGFFTPFILTSFPNVETKSTISPRYFLSRTMGLCLLVGAPILAITYFVTAFVGGNGTSSFSEVFSTSSTMGVISISVLAVALVATTFGAMTAGLFASYQKHNNFNAENPSTLFKVISTTWMVIMTLELVVVIAFAILRLIGAFLDFFRSSEQGSGFFMMLFALMRLFITISYVGMIIYITTKTIAGLWSIDGNVTIPKYNHNTLAQRSLSPNTANA